MPTPNFGYSSNQECCINACEDAEAGDFVSAREWLDEANAGLEESSEFDNYKKAEEFVNSAEK